MSSSLFESTDEGYDSSLFGIVRHLCSPLVDPIVRPRNTAAVAGKVLVEIRNRGLLLHAGGEFPSITTVICGEPISGSWWSHPKANLVYWVMEELDDSGEVTRAKLINGKVTEIHRSLWPALVSIGSARERWQTAGLTDLARALLRKASTGPFRVDEYRQRKFTQKPGDAVRLLEKRLLLYTHEIHTDSGKHTKVLNSWQAWWELNRPQRATLPSGADAKSQFESAVTGYRVKLPWR